MIEYIPAVYYLDRFKNISIEEAGYWLASVDETMFYLVLTSCSPTVFVNLASDKVSSTFLTHFKNSELFSSHAKETGKRVSMSLATAKAYVLDMDADSITCKKLLMSVHKRKVCLLLSHIVSEDTFCSLQS